MTQVYGPTIIIYVCQKCLPF